MCENKARGQKEPQLLRKTTPRHRPVRRLFGGCCDATAVSGTADATDDGCKTGQLSRVKNVVPVNAACDTQDVLFLSRPRKIPTTTRSTLRLPIGYMNRVRVRVWVKRLRCSVFDGVNSERCR